MSPVITKQSLLVLTTHPNMTSGGREALREYVEGQLKKVRDGEGPALIIIPNTCYLSTFEVEPKEGEA